MIVTLFAVLGLFASFASCDITIEDVVARRIKSRRIAFEAHLRDKQAFIPLNRPLIFPVCTVNEGNGYNVKTGAFTAPVAGLYTFNAHLCNKPGTHMVFAIVKGSDQLAVSTTYENTGSGCGFVNTIVRLKRGDVVRVVAKWTGSHLWANLHRWNSFTGYFVYP
ncbi:complement C1q-like protein 4 [Ruditapes philippinarum]|uniref:complement C1q-like protein 4 n=1 Tax=Ruditapes philippinarum TaxID=129788 RepID=UPI00295A8295|nr:complement C1q-like protein 4 [Ruditapes philippinarum]